MGVVQSHLLPNTTSEYFNSIVPRYRSKAFWATQVDGPVSENTFCNPAWVRHHIHDIDLDNASIQRFMWNPTSIGNIAFIALNASDPEDRKKANEIFDRISENLRFPKYD